MTWHGLIEGGHRDGRVGLCGGLGSQRMEVLWKLLELRQREVAAYRVPEDDHGQEDGSEEEGRYLIHKLMRAAHQESVSVEIVCVVLFSR